MCDATALKSRGRHRGKSMFEISIVLLGILLSATIVVAVECYRRLLKAREEYEKAKNGLEKIIFNPDEYEVKLKEVTDNLNI